MSTDAIIISGAREHNLKNLTVAIPRNRLTVITGLSGSGKSSLAFDTLFAEGQRRYVESLSTYARQFLDQMQKPDVDFIEGLSPAIAIEQRTAGSNPRSIVATTTEIHDYLRLLYANVGKPHCPRCGRPVTCQSAEVIVDELLELPVGTRLIVMAPMTRNTKGTHAEMLADIARQGFTRVRVDGQIHELDDVPRLPARQPHTIEAVIDRLVVAPQVRARLTDSVELGLERGSGALIVLREADGAWIEQPFSERFACADCAISFAPLIARSFSFNSPHGACPTCSGLGTMLVLDEELIVPNRELSLADGAVQAWRKGGRRLIQHYRQQLKALAKHSEIDLATPFKDLPENIRKVVLWGSGDAEMEFGYWRGGSRRKLTRAFEGVIPNLKRRYESTDSEYVRQYLRGYMSRQLCTECRGARLKPEAIACTVAQRSIVDVIRLSVQDALVHFTGLALNEREQHIAGDVLREIVHRLRFLDEVGLGYLTLDRESGTLSGGESQRIRLATQIGSGLVGVLYVLDEPTIGLHARDNQRLIGTLRDLQRAGNTVVIVEHDEEMIRQADHVIDLGPAAGRHGGELMASGTVDELLRSERSLTAKYLRGEALACAPTERKPPGPDALRVLGAAEHNLKNIDVAFPLGLFTCVTGVSGSGKSTLVDEILRKTLFRHFYGSKDRPGNVREVTGTEHVDNVIVIDQSPIGRTPRSNPATYTGAFLTIRDLFARTAAARVRGYSPGRFSFNVKGGRCETCKGDGILKLEMHFLPDVYVMCERCGGKRYNRETLEIHYNGKSIADVLEMTIDEAAEFFDRVPTVARKLTTLRDVGLGYLGLGQSATTLSGGEAQRVKLSAELAKRSTGRTVYLLDEPTTGLHFDDIRRLLDVLHRLRNAGNTVIVIEHNLDVIRAADYIIDLGPDGGDAGGKVVAVGTPEAVAANGASHTGRFLKEMTR